MGKKKRRAALDPSISPLSSPPHPPPPPSDMPCSSGMNPLARKKSAHDINTNLKKKPRSSAAKDTFMMDSAVKQSNAQLSLSHHHHHHHHHHQNPGRSLALKRSRYQGAHHHFPWHHSLENHSNNTSIYLGNKRTPFLDQNQKLSFKVGGQRNAEIGHNSDGTDNAFYLPERIRASSSLSTEIISSAVPNMVCELCQELLRHNPEYHHIQSSGIASSEGPSMVAVLVCGHVFHAYCIERRTRVEDARDPPCPLCLGLLGKSQDA